jgi:YfiH family protein
MTIVSYHHPSLPTHWADVGVLATQVGFNLGMQVGEPTQIVAQRRLDLTQYVGAPIQWLEQVHGCTVVRATSASQDTIPQADASLITNANQALAVLTADCLPVVLRVGQGGVEHNTVAVAVVHAGWRGLCAGILQATAGHLANALGLSAPTLAHAAAWLGPAIGPASFEVGQDVYEALQLPQACTPGRQPGKWFVNLYQVATLQLQGLGCQHITSSGFDTFTDPLWYSHRRTQHHAAPAGRFATVVRLGGFNLGGFTSGGFENNSTRKQT